jgi:CTD kinase subunit gamma
MNIFYFLDSLCESSLVAKSKLPQANSGSFYVDHVTRDLAKIVDSVVPEGRQGLPNVMSTRQVRPVPSTQQEYGLTT